jgi:putative peptidoglycan lipid II flippase
LWYAIRIEQLPLALFGIALSAALLPPLARALQENFYERYVQLLRFAFRRSFSFIFPCTLGIFVLGVVGINLLYGHGDFNMQATLQTVICLWGYGLGLLPAVFVLLLAPAFYAKKEFQIPTVGSLLSVGIHVLLSVFFIFWFKWGSFSIAITTSLAAWFNYLYLSYHLSKKLGEPLLNKEVFLSFLKTGVSTGIAASVCLLVGWFLIDDPTLHIVLRHPEVVFVRDIPMQLMQFLALSGTFVLVFFSYAWMLKAEDVMELIGLERKAAVSPSFITPKSTSDGVIDEVENRLDKAEAGGIPIETREKSSPV